MVDGQIIYKPAILCSYLRLPEGVENKPPCPWAESMYMQPLYLQPLWGIASLTQSYIHSLEDSGTGWETVVSGFGFRVSGFGFRVSNVETRSPDLSTDHVSKYNE